MQFCCCFFVKIPQKERSFQSKLIPEGRKTKRVSVPVLMLIASSSPSDDEKNNRKRYVGEDLEKKIAICGWGQKATAARRFICHDVTAVTSGLYVYVCSGSSSNSSSLRRLSAAATTHKNFYQTYLPTNILR